MSLDRWEQFNYIADTTDLKTTEKNLLFIIFRFVNHKTKYANPSRAVLMKKSGIKSEQTLDKVLNELIKKGFLKRKITKGFPSQYFIVVPTENEGRGTTKNEGRGTTKNEGQKENKKKIKENIYNSIFDFWISKNIKKHRSLTNEMKKAIDKTIKDYSESEILEAINNYSVMYNDSAYQWCSHQWGLNEFLVRKDKDGIRQIGMFLNDGSKYLNYLSWKSKNKSQESKEKDIGDLMEQLMANREE